MRFSALAAVAVLTMVVGRATAQESRDLDDPNLGRPAVQLRPGDVVYPSREAAERARSLPPKLSDQAVKFLAQGFALSPEEVRDRYGDRLESALKAATAEKPDSRPLTRVLVELLWVIGTRPGGQFDDLQPIVTAAASKDDRMDPAWSTLLKQMFWMCQTVNPSEKSEDWPYPQGDEFEGFRKTLLVEIDAFRDREQKRTEAFNAALDAVLGNGPDREPALTKLQSYNRKSVERWINQLERSDKERAARTRKAFAVAWDDAQNAPADRRAPRLPGGGENYALLVAVGDYDKKELHPLPFTRPDVREMYVQLLSSGYKPENIVLMHDDLKELVAHYEKLGPDFSPRDYLPEGPKIREELRLLLGRLHPEDSVIVAFSGHGVEFRATGKSYFCPADARLEDANSLIAFSEIYAQLKVCRAERRLLLVDACRNDPRSEIARSRSTVELESVTRPQLEPVPKGIVALFSCAAGQKSFEDPGLGHGLFFFHFLEGWKGNADLDGDGQLTYLELAAYTGRSTSDYAARKLKALQTPELKAEFSGEWVLNSVPRRAVP